MQVRRNGDVKLFVFKRFKYRGLIVLTKIAVLILDFDQLFNYLEKCAWRLLEEDEIQPCRQQYVTRAEFVLLSPAALRTAYLFEH
jgi:hypothetical protein